MSNILNHNRTIFEFRIDRSNHWDFCLALESKYGKDLTKNNTIVDIDLNKCGCVWFDKLTSLSYWSEGVNNGINLTNIGYCGVDNGIISYDKTRITNKMFIDYYVNSILNVEKNDLALHLSPVSGNNQFYDYTCNIIYDEDVQVIECNGGFYQGFWKTTSENYNILPDFKKEPICFEFLLKKTDLENTKITLNTLNPQNKGIFFYLGTRSENKWWKYYNIKNNFNLISTSYFEDEYLDSENNKNEECLDYICENTTEELLQNYLKYNGYISKDYIDYNIDDFDRNEIDNCKLYVNDDYVEPEINIKEDEFINNSDINLSEPNNIKEIITDNKFLLFDRTKDGFTTRNWDEDVKLVIETPKNSTTKNYFLLFNRTKDGLTTKDVDKIHEMNSGEYDVLSDLYENALCFQITDDGELGYKYLVRDCDNLTYKILTEYTYPNIIKEDEWSKINVLLTPYIETNEMILKFYVGNKLKLVSQRLPLINLRELNDKYEKQEGVPYNISLGGGTQGLCDVVYPNYMNTPKYILPLEKEFGGSFIGYIKTFKMYNNISDIQDLLSMF